jgi:hypothetical protein
MGVCVEHKPIWYIGKSSEWQSENASIWLEHAKQVAKLCGRELDECRFREELTTQYGQDVWNETILSDPAVRIQQLRGVVRYLETFYDFREADFIIKVEEVFGQSLHVADELGFLFREEDGTERNQRFDWHFAESIMTSERRLALQEYLWSQLDERPANPTLADLVKLRAEPRA